MGQRWGSDGARTRLARKRRWSRSRVAAPVRGVSAHFVVCHQHTRHTRSHVSPPFLRQTAASPNPTPCHSTSLTARKGRTEGGSARRPFNPSLATPRPGQGSTGSGRGGWGGWDAAGPPPHPDSHHLHPQGSGTGKFWGLVVARLCLPQLCRVSSLSVLPNTAEP